MALRRADAPDYKLIIFMMCKRGHYFHSGHKLLSIKERMHLFCIYFSRNYLSVCLVVFVAVFEFIFCKVQYTSFLCLSCRLSCKNKKKMKTYVNFWCDVAIWSPFNSREVAIMELSNVFAVLFLNGKTDTEAETMYCNSFNYKVIILIWWLFLCF